MSPMLGFACLTWDPRSRCSRDQLWELQKIKPPGTCLWLYSTVMYRCSIIVQNSSFICYFISKPPTKMQLKKKSQIFTLNFSQFFLPPMGNPCLISLFLKTRDLITNKLASETSPGLKLIKNPF